MIAAGVMSGTSLDGIDAACVEIEPDGNAYRIRVLDFATTAWDASLRARLLDARSSRAYMRRPAGRSDSRRGRSPAAVAWITSHHTDRRSFTTATPA